MHFGHGWHQQNSLNLLVSMHVPRRHSRRLLLPPGWVALGFLLLLGCQVLLAHRRQLQLYSVMQLNMPLLEKLAEEKRKKGGPDSYIFSKPLANIKTTTHWRNASFIVKPRRDSVNEAIIKSAVLAIQADEDHARGVRIRFGRGATYSSLMNLLDMMLRLNQPMYWLDIEHRPTTFYIVNGKAVKAKKTPAIRLTYY